MIDKRNEVEHTGLRIKPNHIKDVQVEMKKFPTIRFLYDPLLWEHNSYFEIGIGGSGPELNNLYQVIHKSGWLWEEAKIEVKIPWWKRILRGKS